MERASGPMERLGHLPSLSPPAVRRPPPPPRPRRSRTSSSPTPPPPDVRPAGGVLHHHAQHGLLRVPPRGRGERRGVVRRGAAGGPDTYAGLYQYRVRDILRVAGFHNAAPQFRFARRKNVLLSIESDKSDEAELQRVDRASALLRARCGGAAVVEYTTRVRGASQATASSTGSCWPPRPRERRWPWAAAAWRWRRRSTRCTGRAVWRTAPSGRWRSGHPGGAVWHVRGAHGLHHLPRRVHRYKEE